MSEMIVDTVRFKNKIDSAIFSLGLFVLSHDLKDAKDVVGILQEMIDIIESEYGRFRKKETK